MLLRTDSSISNIVNTVSKNAEKLVSKIETFLVLMSDEYGQIFSSPEDCYKYLSERAKAIEFVYGKGKRKTPLQRNIEKLEEYIERSQKYAECFKKFKGRKSYSKTDEDATFMRMKEDHMRNGQLKPAYNVQIGVEAEYIVGVGLFPNPTDVKTFIPFLERVKTGIRHKILNIIADAGYESEENYVYLKNNEQTAYIKPQNYETSKKRAYKKDKFRVEHLEYNRDKDCFICPNGCELKFLYEKETETENSQSDEIAAPEEVATNSEKAPDEGVKAPVEEVLEEGNAKPEDGIAASEDGS